MAYSPTEQRYIDMMVESYFPTMQPEPMAEEEPSLEGMQLAAGKGTTRTDAPQGYGKVKAPTTPEQAAEMMRTMPLEMQSQMIMRRIAEDQNAGISGAVIPKDMTMREKLAAGMQQMLIDNTGMDNGRARRLAQTMFGGQSSGAPFGIGLIDITPAVIPLATQEAGISAGEAKEAAASGEYGTAALKYGEGVLQSLDAAPGIALAIKGGEALVKTLAPVAADVIETGLRKAGMIMDITPEGPAQVVIPIKIGEREVKIPAQQAATLQKALKNLTPEEQAKFRSDTASKFVTILKQLPSKEEFGAASIAGKAKKGWYEGSTQAIVQVFGPDSSRFAALLSATSPQTSVESNLFNALQVWKNWTAAGRPTDRESIVRVMGQSVQGSKGEESVLDAWINNSVRALSAEDPSTVVLSGPKVNSFMLNLQGNVNEVTNDAWMAAFTYVDQGLFSGSLTKGGDPGKGPGYIAMNARVRETATYLTKITGETWTPAEVQETIWSWAKTLYETAGAKGEMRSAVQLIQDNAITDELIAATPDFRTLFYDERFAPILEQAGYSDQLSKLRAATAGSDAAAGAKKPGSGSQASEVDADSQRKYLERNAKRLDKLRADREKEAAAKAKAKTQLGGVE